MTTCEQRRALDDDAEHPQYVETIPNYGYRFIGILEPEDCVPAIVTAHVSAVEKSGAVSGFRKMSRWKWVAAAALLLAIMTAAVAIRWRQSTALTSNSIAVLPFSNASGDRSLDYLSDGIADNIVDDLFKFHAQITFMALGETSNGANLGDLLIVQALMEPLTLFVGNALRP